MKSKDGPIEFSTHNPKVVSSNLTDASNHLIILSVGANPSADLVSGTDALTAREQTGNNKSSLLCVFNTLRSLVFPVGA